MKTPKLHILAYLMLATGVMLVSACSLVNRPTDATVTASTETTQPSTPTEIPTGTATHAPPPSATATMMSLPVTSIPTGPRLNELEVISAANASGLSPAASLDLREGDQVTWSPAGNAFTVSSPSGMSLYRLESFSAPISLRYQSQPYFSEDGAMMGVRLENGDIQIWDLEGGNLAAELSGLRGEVVYMAFSPDLEMAAAASIDNQVLVWELGAGELITRLEVPEWVVPITYTYEMLFSPDHTELALFREGEALLWEIDGSREPRRLHWEPPPASPVHGPEQLSPDWSAIAWSDRGNILIMDTASGEQLNTFERQVGANFSFTQDWGSLVVIGYNDNVVSVWDPFSGESLQLLEHENSVFRFWLSLDERYLASLTFDGLATLWDLASGEALVVMTAEGESGDWLTFSPQGDQIALLLSDGSISVWDVTGLVKKFTLEGAATREFQFSPDGTLLLSLNTDGDLRFVDTALGEQILEIAFEAAPQEVVPAFVYEGRVLALETGDEMALWGVK